MGEKLIELLYEAEAKCEYADCGQCEYLGLDACGFYMMAEHLITNGVTLQKWIPVSERLPMPYERVLTCRLDHDSGGKHICHEYLTTSYGETLVWCLDLDTWKSVVTHWMPLPEAPKGE